MSANKVELYIYDLSSGMAATLSPMLIGKKIDGIWHTSIVVYGREYFFGSHGVESCNPGSTVLKEPLKKLVLGETQVPYSVFIEYVNGLSQTSYAGRTYQILTHNCNNFSEEIAQFLCGASIPKYILDLPNEVLSARLGSTILFLVSQLEKSARPIAEEEATSHCGHSGTNNKENSPEFDQLISEIEESRYNSFILEQKRKTLKEKLAKKERKKEKKRKKALNENQSGPIPVELNFIMADTEVNGTVEEPSSPSPPPTAGTTVPNFEDEDALEEEERKKSREPPIVYKDLLDAKTEFDALLGLIDGKLSEEEQKSMEELQVYMLGNEGSWALGDGFLTFIGRLLNDKTLPVEVRIRTLNILSIAALKDDVILFLHQDRKDHVLMNYAFDIDRTSNEEQEGIALFIANMFENLSSSEWLMYISEWTYNNQQTSNIRVTTKVAVHSLLSDLPTLQDRGAAIIHNIACKEVKSVIFDDIAVELTMALLQYFNSKPSEEQLYRCFKSLARFVQISTQEVPQLIQMIGPDPKTFKGKSERIDGFIDEICAKLH